MNANTLKKPIKEVENVKLNIAVDYISEVA